MASSSLKKLQASKRKRLGYLQKYHLPTHSDIVLLRLEKAIRQESIKSSRNDKRNITYMKGIDYEAI